MEELPRYLVAAWKYQSAKAKDAKASVAVIAAEEKLDVETLTRCVKFVAAYPQHTNPGSNRLAKSECLGRTRTA